jgi:hypothetical protein
MESSEVPEPTQEADRPEPISIRKLDRIETTGGMTYSAIGD